MDIQNTVHALFEEQTKRQPAAAALILGKQKLSYAQLNTKANQLAHYLLMKGLTANTPVALCIERSFDCLIAMLAILKAGAGYLPIDASHPEERLMYILKDSNASILLTKSTMAKAFSQYQGTLILLNNINQDLKKQPTHNPNIDITPQHLAYVIYTSGSTGTPKGVVIEHRSVVNYCHWFSDYCRPKAKQRIDFSSNHAFDMAVTLSIVPLMLGLTTVICEDEVKKNIRNYLKYLKQTKVTIIKLTPTYFKVLLQEIKTKFIALPHLKSIILGGENLPAVDCKSWLDLYPKHILYNEYGPTETTVGMSQYTVCSSNAAKLDANVPIGKPGLNMSGLILDSNNNRVADQEIGELYIGGTCLARGYLNQPELTQQKFIKDPFNKDPNSRLYKTGDLCRVNADGVLEYFGRIDSQVKIRGFRIDTGEIEKHLSTYSDIDAVVVVTQKDLIKEDCLVAYYILKDSNVAPGVMQLRHYLQKHLPDYMIPTAFIKVNSFPLTANGKLDKSLLPLPQLAASQEYREPTTAVEKTLAGIWAEELGVKVIGLDDDFFELGGHSLSAARIISKINQLLKKQILIHDFYYATTIAKLAALISKTKKSRFKKIKKNISSNVHNIPLSDFQFMLWISNTFESKAKKLNIAARKRLKGQLDKSALEAAFNTVLKKQEVLFYRILKFRPVQLLQKNLPFTITEIDLTSLSNQESDQVLEHSFNQLMDYYPWPKNTPLIMAKLFYLDDDRVELQISLPHIVSDDFSPEILLSELSHYYLLNKQKNLLDPLKDGQTYKEYIVNEQNYFRTHLDRDFQFWEDYLQDTSLFSFPSSQVVKNMGEQAYSTYTPIPEFELNHLKQFCAKNHVSINDGLSAAIALALRNCSESQEHKTPHIYMNIVKSTRNNEVYDKTIGCFLRLEPVKVTLNENTTLSSLSTQIHQSTIDTSLHQQCPDLIKLSSVSTFRNKPKKIKRFIISLFSSLYTTLFSFPAINSRIFKLICERLSSFQRTNNFLININVHRDILSATPKNNLPLFGLEPCFIKNHHYDLLKIDNIFDICFLRDENHNAPYLVISANLKPEFREFIAKETIKIMGSSSFAIQEEPVVNELS